MSEPIRSGFCVYFVRFCSKNRTNYPLKGVNSSPERCNRLAMSGANRPKGGSVAKQQTKKQQNKEKKQNKRKQNGTGKKGKLGYSLWQRDRLGAVRSLV